MAKHTSAQLARAGQPAGGRLIVTSGVYKAGWGDVSAWVTSAGADNKPTIDRPTLYLEITGYAIITIHGTTAAAAFVLAAV